MLVLILVVLFFPMIIGYDKNNRKRFLVCGLFYYLFGAIMNYLDKKEGD